MRTTGLTGRTTRRWAALAAAGGLALAGCGAAGQSSDDAAPHAVQEDAAAGSSASSEASASSRDTSSRAKGGGSTAPRGTHIARTARLSMTVKDVERASARVRSTAAGADGFVSDEDSRSGGGGQGDWAEITITVPASALDSTITQLADIGTVTRRSSDAKDLSTQVADTDARVRSMTSSVERLRRLISTTEDLDEVVTLEGELSRREADLEAIKSQQKSLERRTTTAPITVSLTGPRSIAEDAPRESGFVAGLTDGWDAFTGALTVGLTALGAVTPFALALALCGAPLTWWLRRRRLSAR